MNATRRNDLNDWSGVEVYQDEHEQLWGVYVDDGRGGAAVQKLSQSGEWIEGAGEYSAGEIYDRKDGDTFGVNCDGEFVIDGGFWS